MEQQCTAASLKERKMKVLTNTAKEMIENLVWETYAMHIENEPLTLEQVSKAFLEEKGISKHNNGKLCLKTSYENGEFCNDTVNRTTEWNGVVGLISISDMLYSDG